MIPVQVRQEEGPPKGAVTDELGKPSQPCPGIEQERRRGLGRVSVVRERDG